MMFSRKHNAVPNNIRLSTSKETGRHFDKQSSKDTPDDPREEEELFERMIKHLNIPENDEKSHNKKRSYTLFDEIKQERLKLPDLNFEEIQKLNDRVTAESLKQLNMIYNSNKNPSEASASQTSAELSTEEINYDENVRVLHGAAKALASARAIVITAGSQIGIDKEIDDMKTDEDFWNEYPALKKLGLAFRNISNPGLFLRDCELAWGFHGHRMNFYRELEPQEDLRILKHLSENVQYGVFIITGNVDGQFQKAGFSENRIVECNGSMNFLQCISPFKCAQKGTPLLSNALNPLVNVVIDPVTMRADRRTIPKCPSENCVELARPNILMFNDLDWVPDRTLRQENRFHEWIELISSRNAKVKGMIFI